MKIYIKVINGKYEVWVQTAYQGHVCLKQDIACAKIADQVAMAARNAMRVFAQEHTWRDIEISNELITA